FDSTTGSIVANDTLNPLGVRNGADLTAAGLVPLIAEVKTINGGNVQTSAAYAIEVPEPMARAAAQVPPMPPRPEIANDLTMPEWFYESTGAIPALSYNDIIDIMNQSPSGTNTLTETEAFAQIWPNGINGDGIMQDYLPRKAETYAASLNTPLEHLMYLKGDNWVRPFASIRDGETISVSFEKGESQMEIDFTYNRPTAQTTFNGQVATDHEKSYTLGHFLIFMAGDIDEPTLAAQDITPAMFGAPVDANYPLGNPYPPAGTLPTDATWGAWISGGRAAYEDALKNVQLAKDSLNRDDIGGALGLLSLPPHISTGNGGFDSYDVPAESAGAYTRTGENDVKQYKRYNTATQSVEAIDQPGDSFRISFVSNLGEQNALDNIRVSYSNVPHETMYANETDYSAPQGGASAATINFYDSLGNPKTANIRMAMVSQDNDFTTWRWYADCVNDTDFDWQTDEDGDITTNLNVGTGLIRFDKNGNFVKGAEYSESQGITINQAYRGVNEPIWLKVLNGLSSSSKQDLDFSMMTCSATESDFKLKDQNGRPPATLDTFTVSLDGTITGMYENGNTVVLGRIGLAMIPNENGLIATGDNLFYTGPASGDARYGHANTGGSGDIRHMQLESSNVDLSMEFTKMISTQRGYQANGRTITTADEMIQELLNLKR
ncbi:MAG: flagellar hook-basal body complex protein, partial [Planctomycetota bacterium]|nr:flagellar hook-basal body complex protein [Planctomycetota bacterium]